MICEFTYTVYGTSGNELQPPVESQETFTATIRDNESAGEFKVRMAKYGLYIRGEIKKVPMKSYHVADGLDWRFVKFNPIGILLQRINKK
jgi:hypothetical protein